MNAKKNKISFNGTSHGSYGVKLFDKRWKDKRGKVLQRDNHTCIVCDSNIALQVHHKQYHFSKISRTFKEPWEYDLKYLVTLCKVCHQKGHNKYKIPTKYIK